VEGGEEKNENLFYFLKRKYLCEILNPHSNAHPRQTHTHLESWNEIWNSGTSSTYNNASK
jgi:hypothetical protein